MNDFGLKSKHREILESIFSDFKEVEKVLVFGSRAKETYHERSDLDLVICNSEMTYQRLGQLISAINESDFPYLVDIQLHENINNPELIAHISRVGKVFYQKEKLDKPHEI